MWEPRIKIADFGMSQKNYHNVNAKHGAVYGAPEILKKMRPYDGEKADVFASAFILLAIFAVKRFSSSYGFHDQARSDEYEYFLANRHFEEFWESHKLTPSKELQNLFAGMLHEDPGQRWTVQQIIDCAWMKNEEVPDPIEVSTEANRIIEHLREYLVRLPEKEPIDFQEGDDREVKGDDDSNSEEIEEIIKAHEEEFIQRGLKPEAFKPFMYDLT